MRTVSIKREKSFLGKWMDYYVVVDIPQGELAEYTGVKKYALGFPEGLLQHSTQIFAISHDKSISIKAPKENFTVYAVYFDSSGIRFGPELKLAAGEDDLSLKLKTKMGLSSNKLVIAKA
jgi:hypothetical protein